MNKKDIIKKLEEVYSNSSNGKLTVEVFSKDNDDNIVSSETRILTTGSDEPLYMDKRWEYDDSKRLSKIIAHIRPDSGAPMKIIHKKDDAKDANKVYEDTVLSENEYDSEGRLVLSRDNFKQIMYTYKSDNDYLKSIIDLNNDKSSSYEYKDGHLISESHANIEHGLMVTTTYEEIDDEILGVKCTRKRIRKVTENGKLSSSIKSVEAYDENLNTYVSIKKNITFINEDINNITVFLKSHEDNNYKWILHNDDHDEIATITLKDGTYTYTASNGQQNVVSNPVANHLGYIRSSGLLLQLTQAKAKFHSDLYYYSWVLDSDVIWSDVVTINTSKGKLTFDGTIFSYEDLDDTKYSGFLINKKILRFNFESKDISIKYDYHANEPANTLFVSILTDDDKKMTVKSTEEISKANEIIEYILEDLGLLSNFTKAATSF